MGFRGLLLNIKIMPTGQKRTYKIVKCKDCCKEWSMRNDAIKKWKGRCRSCAQIKNKNTIEMKRIASQNGINYIKKYGKIAGPKLENRPRGENHWHWGKSFTGKDAPNWRGGLTSENDLQRHSLKYRTWREAVFKRDNYTCIGCGDSKGGNLNADHIKPWALYPELRFEIPNGRTFCIPCHYRYGAKVGSNGILITAGKIYNGTNWVIA